eukprot:jgi/Tetstr1/432275/TSEL_002309.t1
MSEYTGMVFGTVGEVSKGVRRTVRAVACLAADWGALSSRGSRLLTSAKKQGASGPPDARHVAVGEAKRRTAERAVVNNIKKAYVSVLAPSQLGVGISPGDSVLIIHGRTRTSRPWRQRPRRKAPADIEWPGLDGNHGISVLNVPFGSPGYVRMRGKAEELPEEWSSA